MIDPLHLECYPEHGPGHKLESLPEGHEGPFFDTENAHTRPNQLLLGALGIQNQLEFEPSEPEWLSEGERLVLLFREHVAPPAEAVRKNADSAQERQYEWPDYSFRILPNTIEKLGTTRQKRFEYALKPLTKLSVIKDALEKPPQQTYWESRQKIEEFMQGTIEVNKKRLSREELLDQRLSLPVLEAVLREQNDPVVQYLDQLREVMKDKLDEFTLRQLETDIFLATKHIVLRNIYMDFVYQFKQWAQAISGSIEPDGV
jgi:hypothetical protein